MNVCCMDLQLFYRYMVVWLAFHTSQSHDINKSLETVRKSSMDNM